MFLRHSSSSPSPPVDCGNERDAKSGNTHGAHPTAAPSKAFANPLTMAPSITVRLSSGSNSHTERFFAHHCAWDSPAANSHALVKHNESSSFSIRLKTFSSTCLAVRSSQNAANVIAAVLLSSFSVSHLSKKSFLRQSKLAPRKLVEDSNIITLRKYSKLSNALSSASLTVVMVFFSPSSPSRLVVVVVVGVTSPSRNSSKPNTSTTY